MARERFALSRVVRAFAFAVAFAAVAAALSAGCAKKKTDADADEAAIGVKECDAYLARFQACLDKMAPSAKQASAPSFDAQRRAFRASARTAEGRDALARQCRSAMDQIASTCAP